MRKLIQKDADTKRGTEVLKAVTIKVAHKAAGEKEKKY